MPNDTVPTSRVQTLLERVFGLLRQYDGKVPGVDTVALREWMAGNIFYVAAKFARKLGSTDWTPGAYEFGVWFDENPGATAGMAGGHALDQLADYPEYLDRIDSGHTLIALVERIAASRKGSSGRVTRAPGGDGGEIITPEFGAADVPPELWTAGKRTTANIEAMALAAELEQERRSPSARERVVLAGYSGWGGLSIKNAAKRFPVGFPEPEERGLIHEFYTPSMVTNEIARVVGAMADTLPGSDSERGVEALEPSAGIGRFIHAFAGVPGLNWHAVEFSELSYRMLRAIRPDIDLHHASFEAWVREHGREWAGRLGLVVSNPPYGARSTATDDPDRAYRFKMAYHYFLARGLDLLAPGGLGVYVVPGGFLTSRRQDFADLRERILKRHHLSAAFRLPTIGPDGRENLFPGAMLVIDLLFFRARGGELAEVDLSDTGIVEGRYFEEFPEHVLGVEVGEDRGDDDQTVKPRNRHLIEGTFTGLPEFEERPWALSDGLTPYLPQPSTKGERKAPAPRVGVERDVDAGATATEELPEALRAAVGLGLRVDAYLSAVATRDDDTASLAWPELNTNLTTWVAANGNPHKNVELHKLARAGITGAERILTAFDKDGTLIKGLRAAPAKPASRFTGKIGDIAGQARTLYARSRYVTTRELATFHRELGGTLDEAGVTAACLAAGWCLDGEGWNELWPLADYLTGNLWPKVDRAMARGGNDVVARAQAGKLMGAIAPAIFDDIDGVSARQGWVPINLVSQWINDTYSGYDDVTLEVKDGLVGVQGKTYEALDKHNREQHPHVLLIIGWINHDKTLFRPRTSKHGEEDEKDVDKARLKLAAEWDASFKGWAGSTPERRLAIEHAYNRQFRGYVAPNYGSEPLTIVRWTKDPKGKRPHAHQVAGARRVVQNRGGLLAFDVGVGKTMTGLAVLARAKQEGWAKRPVVLVPNSIAWKWFRDFEDVLPDYRVAVIGSKRSFLTRGPRLEVEYQRALDEARDRGENINSRAVKDEARAEAKRRAITSKADSSAERAAKWTKFQAGEYDAVILTYSMLARTRMNERAVRDYADKTAAIQREIKLRQRNAKKRKKLSERDEAIINEGVTGWVKEKMELPKDHEYDPGIAWDDIGVDLLIVDEAQNYKNLYLPEEREGGVPRFMGNPGDGSNRAWQLDFRCSSVRKRSGGGGVLLLSATPAKNSPLEFYNLIQYVDPEAWTRLGIRDPEGFIDRYLKLEMRMVVTPTMEVQNKSAVVGFQNLHELRDVVFRYGEFKTAEDVGIPLPEPHVELVEVDMDATQDAKYDRYVREIESSMKSTDPKDKAKILGLLARMSTVAIHGQLDEGFDWKTAHLADPNAPKFTAIAERIVATATAPIGSCDSLSRFCDCGHIIFVENVAAHQWIRSVLVNAGIPTNRIAILNADAAKGPAERQQIAQEFNGDPDEGIEPRYDVVIANSVAYEGIDLQTRTCAIHHVDLPWEPATLQQRNGRGVRQGNKLGEISIYYYFSRRSQDGLRYDLIQNKRGWMVQLIKSQDRDTNNPGAQSNLGPEEILALISRDPEATKLKLAEIKAAREAEARKKVAIEASKLLQAVNGRFRNAERTRDPIEKARLRGEAEERLKAVVRTDPEAWPWGRYAEIVREQAVKVVEAGPPLYDGLRIGVPSAWNAAKIDYIEFGGVSQGQPAKRPAGEASWTPVDTAQLTSLASLKPESYAVSFPADEIEATMLGVRQVADNRLRYSGDWPGLRWGLAPDRWVEEMWPMAEGTIIEALSRVSYYNIQNQKIPVSTAQGLRIASAAAVRGQLGQMGGMREERVISPAVIPPTDAGWRTFLAMAPTSGLKFGELAEAGKWWWDRAIPRNLLSAAEDEENAPLPAEAGPLFGRERRAEALPAKDALRTRTEEAIPFRLRGRVYLSTVRGVLHIASDNFSDADVEDIKAGLRAAGLQATPARAVAGHPYRMVLLVQREVQPGAPRQAARRNTEALPNRGRVVTIRVSDLDDPDRRPVWAAMADVWPDADPEVFDLQALERDIEDEVRHSGEAYVEVWFEGHPGSGRFIVSGGRERVEVDILGRRTPARSAARVGTRTISGKERSVDALSSMVFSKIAFKHHNPELTRPLHTLERRLTVGEFKGAITEVGMILGRESSDFAKVKAEAERIVRNWGGNFRSGSEGMSASEALPARARSGRKARRISEDAFDRRYGGLATDDDGEGIEIDDNDFGALDHALAQRRLWTHIEDDEGNTYLVPGLRRVNRIRHLTSIRPWSESDLDDLEVRWTTSEALPARAKRHDGR